MGCRLKSYLSERKISDRFLANKLRTTLLLLGLLFLLVSESETFTKQPLHWTEDVDFTEGVVNKQYEFSVHNGTHIAIVFTLSEENINFMESELRLEVELLDKSFHSGECPLLVTMSQGKHITSFDLPHEYTRTNLSYPVWGKTICVDQVPQEGVYKGKIQISVVTSTCNTRPILFRLTLRHSENALALRLGESVEVYVAPTTARFYKYTFPIDGPETVIVKMDSEYSNCMTISVQYPSCPVFDTESTVRHSGFWQTFTTRTGATIERSEFPNGFFLVLVTEFEDSVCENKDGFDNRRLEKENSNMLSLIEKSASKAIPMNLEREKKITFTVKKTLSPSQYVWPTLFPYTIYFPVILFTFLIYIWFHRANVARYVTTNKKPEVSSFLRSEKYISDKMDGFKREKLAKKSQRYCYLLVTVAIFYCIPVFQLIINYFSIVYRTGEQDLCYYNNLCSLPLNDIMDFNHIYSNVGYLVFGIIFICFTFMRQKTMEGRQGYFVFETNPVCCRLLDTIPRRLEFGTFDQYGIFYSLGFALFMEGWLSASYHICPSKANFQFDTSFMYAMAVLSYVKVYQFRHFLYMNELMAFLLLALVVACVVFGLFSTNLYYNILLSFVHLMLVIGFQLFLLFISRNPDSSEEDEESTFSKIWGIIGELCFLRKDNHYLIKYHPNKSLFWWTVIWNILLVINSWTLVYGSNFATQVLYILLANLALYVIYYFIMKTIHGEFEGILSQGIRNPSLQPLLYGIISFVFWLPGLYFFMNPSSTWELSPAESKEMNESCALLQFFDLHDLWHLASAPALFFSFMMFLTVDDGLIGTHHECIPTF